MTCGQPRLCVLIRAFGLVGLLVAALSPVVSVSAEPAASTTHVVQPGETLSGIAESSGLTSITLARLNGLDDANILAVGQTLMLPAGSPASAPIAAASGPVSAGSGSANGGSQAATAAGPASGAAPVTAAAPRRSLLVSYTVQPGETLNQIARQFDLKPDAVIQANGLDDPNRLSVGAVLKLPLPGREHVVQSGETLRDIAAQEKVDLGSLVDFNAIDDPGLIRVGQVVLVPPAPSLKAAPNETDAAQRAAPVTAAAIVPASPPSAGVPPPAPAPKSVAATAQPASSGSGAAAAGSAGGTGAGSTGAAGGGSPADTGAGSLGAADSAAAGDGAATGGGQPSPKPAPIPAPAPAPASVPASRPPSAPVPAAPPDSLAGAGLKLVGSAYVWGGSSPSGFDCSGFVWYIARQAGRPLSRGLLGEFNASSAHPSRDDLKPGDLVFFQNTYAPGLSHNGIYIGNGQFVHAADEKAGVTVSSLSAAYWQSHWFGATRLS